MGKKGTKQQKKANTDTPRTNKEPLRPKTIHQNRYCKVLDQYPLVIAYGPAGTGKTYIAVRKAVDALLSEQISKIVISRPVVEAGEKMGFLPGSFNEKIQPYMTPIFDALRDGLWDDQISSLIREKRIEVAPLAFMRGRTFNDAHVILDEAQNATVEQMYMLLTRMGKNCRMVICGDSAQVDLDRRWQRSGLADACRRLRDTHPDLAVFSFEGAEVVRHPLVAHVIEMYKDDTEQA